MNFFIGDAQKPKHSISKIPKKNPIPSKSIGGEKKNNITKKSIYFFYEKIEPYSGPKTKKEIHSFLAKYFIISPNSAIQCSTFSR